MRKEELDDILANNERDILSKLRKEFEDKYSQNEAERLDNQRREQVITERTEFLIKKFKGRVWELALPGLFLSGLDDEARGRRLRLLKSYADIIPPVFESLKTTCKNIAMVACKELWSVTESLHVLQTASLVAQYPGEKAVAQSDVLDKRCEELERILNKFMEVLVEQTKENVFRWVFVRNYVFSQTVLTFLGAYTENGSYLYDKFHFDFEISRFDFNSWGAIKNITKELKRMVLTMFVMFHTMFPLVFARPWEIDPVQYAINQTRILNIRIAGSILYHYFIDNFKKIERLKNNQAQLEIFLQNNARKDNYKFGRLRVTQTTESKSWLARRSRERRPKCSTTCSPNKNSKPCFPNEPTSSVSGFGVWGLCNLQKRQDRIVCVLDVLNHLRQLVVFVRLCFHHLG